MTNACLSRHDTIVAMMRSFYDAIARGDFDTVNTILSPDVRVYEAESLPYAGTFEGHAGFLDLMMRVAEQWRDLLASDFRYYTSEHGVLVRLLLTATSRATGRLLNQELIEAWTVDGQRLVEGRIFYFDTFAARALVEPIRIETDAGTPQP